MKFIGLCFFVGYFIFACVCIIELFKSFFQEVINEDYYSGNKHAKRSEKAGYYAIICAIIGTFISLIYYLFL